MTTLTKFIYGTHTDAKKTPFGFLNQQKRITNSIIECAGWFNSSGERLGSGDLSMKDMDKVAKSIPANEKFLVLSEGDALWNIPSSTDSSAPGIEYVMQRCVWCISTGSIIRVRDAENEEEAERDGVKYKRVSRNSFYTAIGFIGGKIQEPAPPVKLEKKKLTVEEATKIIVNKIGMLGTKKGSLIGTTTGSKPSTVPTPTKTTPQPTTPATAKPTPKPNVFKSFPLGGLLPKKITKKKIATPSP